MLDRYDVAGIIKFKSLAHRESFVTLAKAHGDLLALNFNDEIDFPKWTWEGNAEPHKSDPIMTFKYEQVMWDEDDDDIWCHIELCRYAEHTFGAVWRIVTIGNDGHEVVDHGENSSLELEKYISTVHKVHTTF